LFVHWSASRVSNLTEQPCYKQKQSGFLGLASCFLEDGREYVYKEEGIQTAGTMDFTPAAAGMSWTSTVRLQVWTACIH